MGVDHNRVLEQWDAAVFAEAVAEGDPPAFLTAVGSVFRPGASPDQLEGLERRLGVRLPPSYRAFLLRSDGAHAQPGWGFVGDYPTGDEQALGLLDCAGVGWLRELDRSCVDIWTNDAEGEDEVRHPAFAAWSAEDEYLAHEPGDEEMKPGHLLYALQIAGDIDGYTVLLNPLVVDQAGEWEAWDFGPKNPGACRFRSFAELLLHQAGTVTEGLRAAAADLPDRPGLVRMAEDARAPVEQRLDACAQLVGRDAALAVPTLAAFAADPAQPLEVRSRAAEALAGANVATARAALRALAEMPVLPAQLRAPVVNGLAHGGSAEDASLASDVLARPGLEDSSISQLWPVTGEVAWAAWQQYGDPRLLECAAWSRRSEVGAPIAAVIADASQPLELRQKLVSQASLTGDPDLVPALLTCALQGGVRPEYLARALDALGAPQDALAVLSQGVRHGDSSGRASQSLGWTDGAEAGQVLLSSFEEQPTAPLAVALGWHNVPGAATALVRTAVSHPELAQACVDGLERMQNDAADDGLCELADGGDLFALGALARRRDPRALAPLLALLADPAPARALAGADGLRDLRDPSAAGALLDAVTRPEAALVATATHALVMLGAPHLPVALAELRARSEKTLQTLAVLWSDTTQ